MVNGYDRIFIEQGGKLSRYPGQFASPAKLSDVIQSIAARANKRVNEASPILDTRLEDGSRVNIVLAPVCVGGPAVTIRRFPEKAITMDTLITMGSITTEAAQFLRLLVVNGYNLFISGGTGSGKTTMLNALSDYIPRTERIITIEDSAELRISHISNLVSLECRQANTEGENAVTIRDLIRTSLRMRPDRIVVVDEYPKHILLEMTYTGSYFGIKVAPRKIRRRINKAAMFCGDVQIRRTSDNRLLTGDIIKHQVEIKLSKGHGGGYGNSAYLKEGYVGY